MLNGLGYMASLMEIRIMTNPEIIEPRECFIPLVGHNCPEACPGMLDSKFLRSDYGGEGCLVQICPNPETLDKPMLAVDYCGNGPDVVIIYRDTVPSDQECKILVDQAEW